nr:BFH_HP1_G0048600.mRNA.1.CDS.1 [Saccharomyces cerevisiae]
MIAILKLRYFNIYFLVELIGSVPGWISVLYKLDKSSIGGLRTTNLYVSTILQMLLVFAF